MTNNSKIVVFDKVLKSINDPNNYDTIILDNGLKVFVVNDSTAQNCAAALSVGVGSLQNKYGLAHFLEHMIFLGSEKYKSETIFGDILAKYDGTHNAYTDMNYTCYYFSVSCEAFEKTLDIFCNFFVNPLFTKSAIEREMNAVQAEHNKNFYDDGWRESQMLRDIADPSNIMNGFGTGNIESLNLPDIQDRLRNFFNKYYRPDDMYLVLSGPKSTDELINLAQQIFIQIPVRKKINEKVNEKLPYKHQILLIKAINKKKAIRILWQIPNAYLYKIEYAKYNPLFILIRLLTQRNYGSLNEYFRVNNLTSVLFIEQPLIVGNVILLIMEIQLTDLGFLSIQSVIDKIYEYIDIIKNADNNTIHEFYNEIRLVSRSSILNFTKGDQLDYIVNIASILARYKSYLPIQETLVVEELLSEYSNKFYDIFKKLTSYLTRENSVVFIISNDFEELKEREKWYQIEYEYLTSIPKDEITLKNNSNLPLYLPKMNTFICTKNDLIKNIKPYKNPVLIKSFSEHELWYQFTNQFKTPFVDIITELFIPNLKESIKIYLAFRIFILCVLDEMTPDLYEYNTADYMILLNTNEKNLTLIITGPSEKIKIVTETLINDVNNISIRKTTFKRIKKRMHDILTNSFLLPPFQQINIVVVENIIPDFFSVRDLLDNLDDITYDEVINSKFRVFSKLVAKTYISGNIIKDEAIELASIIHKLLPKHETLESDEVLIKTLNKGEVKVIKQKLSNLQDPNSVLGIYYSLGYTRPVSEFDSSNLLKSWNGIICLSKLIESIIASKYLDELRTIEQLGYVVISGLSIIGSDSDPFALYSFVIQSNIKDSEFLKNRTLKFVATSRKLIMNESENDLEIRKKSLIESIGKKPNNLLELSGKNMLKAFYSDIMDNDDVLIKTYNSITKKDLIKFYDYYFLNTKNRSVWIIQMD